VRYTQRYSAAHVYLLSQAAGNFGRGLVYTVLAIYYITVVGLNPLQLILVGTVLEAAGFLFELPTGVLADVFGRRVTIILGRLLIGVTFIAQGLTSRFEVVLLAEALRALGEACLNGATQAWLAGEVDDDQIGRLFLRGAQVRSAAYLVGVVASVALASWQLNLPILIGGAFTLLLAVFLTFAMPEHRSAWHPASAGADLTQRWTQVRTTGLEGVRAVAAQPMLRLLLGLAVCAGASSEGFDRLCEAHFLESFALPPLGRLQPVAWFGIIEAGALLLGIVAVQVMRGLSAQPLSRQLRFLRAIQLVRIGTVIGFGLAPTFGVALLLFWAARVTSYVGTPFYETWRTRTTPERLRATVLSVIGQGDALGQVGGGPVIGAIATTLTLRAAIVATGLLLTPSLALLTSAKRLSVQGKHR